MTKKRHKARSRRRGAATKRKVRRKTRYFTVAEVTKLKDLKTEPLQIRQLVPFGASRKAQMDVDLELWEIQPKGSTDRGKSFRVLQIKGKVMKASGHKFEVVSIEQDAKDFPKPENKNGKPLWLPAKLEVLDTDGQAVPGGSDLEFVLPPLEYDETLELKLGCSFGNAACGVAKVTWDSLPAVMNALGVVDKSAGIPKGRNKQLGKLKKVVIHSMSAINTADTLENCFDVDCNLQIFKDTGLSAHFIIDRGGSIVQAVELNNKCSHAFGGNRRSIGIELLGFGDDFRQRCEDRYEELSDAYTNRDAVEKKLKSHRQSKASGQKFVTVNAKDMPVDEAISHCERALKKLNRHIEKIEKKKWKKWTKEDYENWVKDKDANSVPLVYTYTEKQYESLNKLLEALSKRYGYEEVLSHHRLDKRGKKWDPGKYFDWDKLLPHLPPGELSSEREDKAGGLFKVG